MEAKGLLSFVSSMGRTVAGKSSEGAFDKYERQECKIFVSFLVVGRSQGAPASMSFLFFFVFVPRVSVVGPFFCLLFIRPSVHPSVGPSVQ